VVNEAWRAIAKSAEVTTCVVWRHHCCVDFVAMIDLFRRDCRLPSESASIEPVRHNLVAADHPPVNHIPDMYFPA